jgi:hypothetical protein
VNEFAGGKILPSHSTNPLEVNGLVVRHGDRVRFLLANMTAESQEVVVKDISTTVLARRLNESSIKEALCSPDAYRAQEGESLTPKEKTLNISLMPYEVVRIDGL